MGDDAVDSQPIAVDTKLDVSLNNLGLPWLSCLCSDR